MSYEIKRQIEALDFELRTCRAAPQAPAPVGEKQTPYANCRYRICDLPGQCRGEGKCHHPAAAPQAPAPTGIELPNTPGCQLFIDLDSVLRGAECFTDGEISAKVVREIVMKWARPAAAPQAPAPLTDAQSIDIAKFECKIQFSNDDIREDNEIETIIALARAILARQSEGGAQG